MIDKQTDRIYTRFALIASIIVILFLLLTACSPEETCATQADQLPDGMVNAWRIQDGKCQIQINQIDGQPGDWFDADHFKPNPSAQ